MSGLFCGLTFLACLMGASFLRRTTINDLLLSTFVAVTVHVLLQGAPDMAQDTKWFKMAQTQLANDDVQGAIETCVKWSAGKNWEPDARYFSIIAEIADRSMRPETAAVCDKQARQLNLEKKK